MICDSQNASRARTGLAALVVVALAGSAAGQIDTRSWLLPQSGLWSDTANWSDANVPDSASEIARLSPMPLVGLGGGTPRATVDGLYEVLRLQGNGTVEVFIDEGSELFVSDGVIEGDEGGHLVVTLGSSSGLGSMPSTLTLGSGAGRQAGVGNTTILMQGEEGNISTIQGGMRLTSASRLEGQGNIENITNYGEILATQFGTNPVPMRIHKGLLNYGTIEVDPTSQLIIDGFTMGQNNAYGKGYIQNDNIVTILGGGISGGMVRGGSTEWIGNCTLSRCQLDGGYSFVDGLLDVIPSSSLFASNWFFLENGSEMRFSDTVFLQGKTQINEPRREIYFEPAENPPMISAPEGETIVAMPGYKITGAGIIDANFLNFGTLKTNRGADFEPVAETIEIRGELSQTSDATLEIAIDPNDGDLVVDRLVVTDGDAELDGLLKVSVLVNFTNDPFNQIALANKTLTLVQLEDSAGVHAVNGTFSSVETQVFDDRISNYPEVTYHPDRVDVRFYCRADVNRNGTVEPADFTAWLSAYQNGSPLADMTGNGVLTSADFTKWVDLYNQGCPD